MTTKDFLFKNKHKLFGTNKSPNGQYRNLNLNQNHQSFSFNAIFKLPKNVSTEKVLKCGFSNNDQTRKNSKSWKNSTKDSSSNFAKCDGFEKGDELKKEKTSTATNNSTLSLHIKAYENSIETTALDSFNETKKQETDAKQISSVSDFVIQNPFEFPRMMLRYQTPETSYFRASQRLLNPNHQIRIRAPFPQGYGARLMPPLPQPPPPPPQPSYQYDNEEDKENVIQMMQAFQRRMNSRFNKAFFPWSQYFGIKYNKKMMSNSFEITLKKEENKFYFFAQLLPIGPVFINKFGCQIAIFDPERGNEKEFIELLSEFDIVNLSYIKISESDYDLIKYSDEMLKTLLASKKYSINQAPMTIFGGYIPEYLLKKYLPLIQSSNVMLRCNFGFEKPNYYDIIKAAKHQTCFHFDRKVIQKFSKKKHFIKLGETILSNPTIEGFSFVCNFSRFNFKEFFEFIADPNLKIKNQTINLSFSFYSKLKWIAEFVGEANVKLNKILEDRAQESDSIRVVFNTAKKKARFHGIQVAE